MRIMETGGAQGLKVMWLTAAALCLSAGRWRV
jgi:hypothetical protein